MSEDLAKVNEALASENASLKNVIDSLSAEKQALEQTVNDVLRANITLKAGTILFERQAANLKAELVQKDALIAELSKEKGSEPASKKAK